MRLALMLYAAKCYWPGVTETDVEQVAARAGLAGLDSLEGLEGLEGLAAGGNAVAYLGSLLFADDDLVLCLFRGPSRAAVIRASGRLGIPCERLMDLAWLGPGPPIQEEAPPRSPPSGR